MKFCILSDTHDNLPSIEHCFNSLGNDIEIFIHCGDWKSPKSIMFIQNIVSRRKAKLYGVLGNRDLFSLDEMQPDTNSLIEKESIEFMCDNLLFVVCHGHKKKLLHSLINTEKYDVIFTGHTHKPLLYRFGKTYVINPGSTSFAIPRRKDFIGTYAIFDTEKKEAKICEI